MLGQTDCGGAARLPGLAMHSVMSILVREADRYSGCVLLPLSFQAAAGRRTGLAGNIQIRDQAGMLVAGYAVLGNIPIAAAMIQALCAKLTGMAAPRYYLLTADQREDYSEFNPHIDRLARVIGCQLTVDDFGRTLRHCLQLIKSAAEFVDECAARLETDPAISAQLKQAWNEIIAG